MEIDFRDLRWAIVTSQHSSIRQAAESLNVRQSTLSRRLRELETQVGTLLFERNTGGTHPTIEGREFLETARSIVEEAEATAVRLKTRSRGESGRLMIGVHASMSAGNLRATIIEFLRRYPDVELVLVDGSSDHLTSDLRHSAIDVAFVVQGASRWEDSALTVWSERVVVALPDGHVLHSREAIQWSDLGREALILPHRGPGAELQNLVVSKLGRHDVCRVVRHDVGIDRLLTLVGAGCGVMLVLEGATGATYPGVVYREVHDTEGASRLNFRAFWQQRNLNPSLLLLLNMLRERYPDLSSPLPT